MSRKWVFGAAACGLALALAAGIAWWMARRAKPLPAPEQVQQATPALYQGSEVLLSGRVEPRRTIPVAAPIDGVIESFDVQIGQEVFEGQLLARIRNAALSASSEAASDEVSRLQNRLTNLDGLVVEARLEVSRARADATRAASDKDRLERAWERQKLLYAAGATPRLVYEKAERDYQKAKADQESIESVATGAEERLTSRVREQDEAKKVLADKEADADQARAHLEAGEVKSPVDGIVVALRGQAGDEITPDSKDLVQVAVDVSQLQVTLTPEPAVMRRLRGGEPALVTIPELQYPPQPGEVKMVAAGGRIVVEFASPDPQIRPGLNVQVRIRLWPQQ